MSLELSANGIKYEGWMHKRGDKSTHGRVNWKKRYWILTENELAYFEKPPQMGKVAKPKGVIALTGLEVKPEVDDKELDEDGFFCGKSFCFKFVPEGPKQYYVSCDTSSSKTDWLIKLKQAGIKGI
eukprot:TRINITY_DN15348_c0_g1_i1.p1 TRINITY_DN15348_c0_g1~~TRINITY_DN15348_c0_g1_i1.p1  ORF type:complete len:126 (-),score=24.66 TRINITY_DN15348_c0_g1_i1:132-509(-)